MIMFSIVDAAFEHILVILDTNDILTEIAYHIAPKVIDSQGNGL